MLSLKSGFVNVLKQACSRTIQTSGADHFLRGAHHRRCAREGLTGLMMPYKQGPLQLTGPGGATRDLLRRPSISYLTVPAINTYHRKETR